ncbi:hypothetical protein AB0383_23890 [Amycolatopsis sp. NPDC051373]|uniref:hypothetical protein n=1 Tax=Amycolatopsis sp. NPDC051373 TaxID=3155801 RepID=UPI0034510EA4
MTDKITSAAFGEVEVTRVHEWSDHLFSRPELLPDSGREGWEAEKGWLEPVFWSAESEDAWLRHARQQVEVGFRAALGKVGRHSAPSRTVFHPMW